jgi:hypothetical protein
MEDNVMKTCPFCAEEIQDEAVKCKHCGEWLSTKQESTLANMDVPLAPPKKNRDVFLIGIMIAGVIIENLSFIGTAKPNSAGFLWGVILVLLPTYKLCQRLEFSTVKKTLVCFVNLSLVINIFLTIGLIIEYRKKANRIKIATS